MFFDFLGYKNMSYQLAQECTQRRAVKGNKPNLNKVQQQHQIQYQQQP